MRFRHDFKAVAGTFLFLFLFMPGALGQMYSFRNYGAESNIPSGYIYTINQSDDGFLWVGTGNGLARFDGISFFRVPYPDSTTLRIPTSSLRDSKGTIWFGCNDGTVYYSKHNSLIQVQLPNERLISSLAEGPDGRIFVIPQGKAVFGISPGEKHEVQKYAVPDSYVMTSGVFVSGNRLLLGTQENLIISRVEKDTITFENSVEGFDYSSINAIALTGDSSRVVIGTDGNGLFNLHLTGKGYTLGRIKGQDDFSSLSVQSVFTDSENNIWVSTYGSGVIQILSHDGFESAYSVRKYNTASGLESDDTRTVFQDNEGNYWIGTQSVGLCMLTSYSFGYYRPGSSPAQNNIIYATAAADKYLLGTPSGVHLFDAFAGRSVSYTDLSGQLGNAEITSYLLDSDGNLLVGTGGRGLFMKTGSGKVRLIYRSGDTGSDYIKDIAAGTKYIWLATTNGVIVLNRQTGAEVHRFDINNGLPHNSINKIMLSSDGMAYIGTESDRLFSVDSEFRIIQGDGIMYGSTINKVLAFAEGKDGRIWAATKSNGVFGFLNDSVYAVNRANDLLSNYCYSILSDSEGNIWIGHEKGFSRYNPMKGTMRVFGSDFTRAGVCNTNAMYESADGKIFIGTTDGLIVYDRAKDRKGETPPLTNINYIMINDDRYDYKTSISLPYKKRYAVRINYVGIKFSNPGKVYYSTYLENFDNDWSSLTTSRETMYNLRDGSYRFSLVSVNEDGLSQGDAISFDLFIHKPFWRTWWFVLLSVIAGTGVVILIIRQREKAQKKLQEYLETELMLRTREVVSQKEKIERQNTEITDSITYAKRIQSSILPDINKLKETFRDAFILYQPRDIVSGDFYWYDRIEQDRFILVCADSTGHGVPGAFMSMIGSTLLQDIVTRKGITKPSEVLSMLDRQIFTTLNQNVELGASNDGMDVIVCDFNLRTRHLRFASAMRPVILLIGGESYYVKGNRSSIGGEIFNDKFFDDQEYYLNENDSVYLFSDGLSDQFGGPDGKKMKISRLRKMIEEVSGLPMEEQRKLIQDYYDEWKGDYEQVDDILLMGIKI